MEIDVPLTNKSPLLLNVPLTPTNVRVVPPVIVVLVTPYAEAFPTCVI